MHLTCRIFALSLVCAALVACGPNGGTDLPDGSTIPTPDGGPDATAPPPVIDAGPDAHMGVCGDGVRDPGEACDDHNGINGDGCEANCSLTPTAEIQCETLAPLAEGVCSVTPGDASKLFKGTVLTPGKVYRGGQVAVNAAGAITCVGCDCAAQTASATVITCPKGVISPGLINTHDHITFTQNNPYTQTAERYEQRHDWRKGIRSHTKIPSPGSANSSQMSWGELRFLMGGATSIVGSGGAAGLLRNLDRAGQQEDLGQNAVKFETFPLDDSDGQQITGSCNYGTGADSESTIATVDSYLPHVSEGIDAEAHNEFLCVSSATYDTTAPGISHVLTQSKSAFIHGIALTAADYKLMADDGTGLIWSPRSNITLYGNTAEVTLADRLGVQIALGTDWMPTGSMSLLRELRCASELNDAYLGGYFSDEDLWKMVTVNAAAVTATDDVIGLLSAGRVADITIFDGSVNDSFKAVVAAEPADVALVVRAGKALYGDDALVAVLATGCDSLDVCSTAKRVCLMSEIGKTLAQLQTAVGTDYPTFFCGEPTNEPSCLPARTAPVAGSTVYTGAISAMDSDGDGILDAADNCPHVFNPVRPLDLGTQANADGDADGDVCDPCPLDADTTACLLVNPDDGDSDGVPNYDDNCPGVANHDQLDSDGDHKGDACDACPGEANPGSTACVVSIYDIKKGVAPVGAIVGVRNALVTARVSNGAFLQVKEGDIGFMGADFSGVFVFGANSIALGDRVDVSAATVAVFGGEIELTGAAMTATTHASTPPAPIVVTPAQVVTGGARAAALEGVLVQVADVTVASLDTTNFEFVVDGGLHVDDLFFRANPFPIVGQNFATVTGVLALRDASSKIELRSSADLVNGTAILNGFGPALSSVNVGQTNVPTVPTPLTVSLLGAVASDTFVAVTSADPTALTVVGGGVTIPAGQISAPVRVNGLAQAASVQLAATLASTVAQAHVRVVGAGENATLIALTPPMQTTTPGGTVHFSVSLDLPAPAGGTVVTLALTPANAGTMPTAVTVAAGQQSVSFDYVDGSVAQAATVTATLGTVSLQSAITIVAVVGRLVINEIDYDQSVNPDAQEYIELYNGTSQAVDLSGKKILLINGSGGATYKTIDLSSVGSLPAGGYLVVASDGVTTIAPGALVLRIMGTPQTDLIQNGAPDGIALIDATAGSVIDVLSYEGAMTSVTLAGISGPVSLVEGTVLPTAIADVGAGALCRAPNGQDSNNAASDWKLCATPSPGAANIP